MIRRKVAAYIHKSSLIHNYIRIKALAGPAKICAVVKANAYGHGAVAVSRILDDAGVDYFAVAFLEEALELRRAGIAKPILILGTGDPANASIIVENDITQTVYTIELAKALSKAAGHIGKPAKVHLKIDTGMHRQGIGPSEAGPFARFLRDLPALDIEGVYSHFAEADSPDRQFSELQLARFHEALNAMACEGIHPRIRHLANSAALISMPEARLDMVRPGIILYGLSPDGQRQPPEGFLPVMQFCASIIGIHMVPKGEGLSYGRTFVTKRDTSVALLQVGYADGYSRLLSNRATVLVKGKPAPVIGRICMDQCLVDVTDIPGAQVGDEVTLFGTAELPAGELSGILGSIDYELTCAISQRVQRIVED
ncbi:MAG: alanine racemase [Spirochaetaceae bacterium]|nr:alanine racemase [Spirochaetaceae bacterium]